jgi:hypothetical protein
LQSGKTQGLPRLGRPCVFLGIHALGALDQPGFVGYGGGGNLFVFFSGPFAASRAVDFGGHFRPLLS